MFKPILSKNFFQQLKELNADKYVNPKKHDLMALAVAAGILPELDEATKDFFDLLSQYYLESRYVIEHKTIWGLKNSTNIF